MISTYSYQPVLVDLPDHPLANVKLRARRVSILIPDTVGQPCVMQVELIPYARTADGEYGPELTTGVFTRYLCKPLAVSDNRLVDVTSGLILASRFAADGSLRPEADWLADEARIRDNDALHAMPQGQWFAQLLEQGLPAPINAFSRQYMLLAHSTGDLI